MRTYAEWELPMQERNDAHRGTQTLKAACDGKTPVATSSRVAVCDTIPQEFDELLLPLNRWIWASPAEREDSDHEQVMSLPIDLAWYDGDMAMLRPCGDWRATICQSIEGEKVKIIANGLCISMCWETWHFRRRRVLTGSKPYRHGSR